MIAKMYTFENALEVRVSNQVYSSVEGESKKVFTKRVLGLLEKDFDEAIDIVEITKEQLAKHPNARLIEAYKVSKGLQEQIIEEILKEKGISVEKVEKTARKKVEKLDIEEVKKSEAYLKAKSNIGKLASFIPTSPKEVPVIGEDGEPVIGEDGKKVLELEVVNGVVKSISLNKTNTIIYYNIASGTNLRCCTSKNESLEFFEF